MGVIYSLYNTKSKKAYIGQTIQPLKQRVNKHFQLLRRQKHPNIHLQRSYNRDKEKSFTYFILTSAPQKDLDKIEKYYIALFQTMNDQYGYNMTEGGTGVISKEAQEKNKRSNQAKWPDVLQICPKTFEILAIFPSIGEAARQTNFASSHIHLACKNKGLKRYGFHWVYEHDIEGWKPPLNKKSKPYCLINKENVVVDIFRTESEMEWRANTSKPVIKKRANTNIPLVVRGEECFVRSLTHEEYYIINIGTCIDYPRKEE